MSEHTAFVNGWDDEKLWRAIRGEITVTRRDQPWPMRLRQSQQEAFINAQEQGYVIVASKQDWALQHVFDYWCDLHQQPLIYIEKRGSRYVAKMDLIVLVGDKGRLDEKGVREVAALFKSHGVLQQLRGRIIAGGISSVYNYARLPTLEEAEQVAQGLRLIWQGYATCQEV